MIMGEPPEQFAILIDELVLGDHVGRWLPIDYTV